MKVVVSVTWTNGGKKGRTLERFYSPKDFKVAYFMISKMKGGILSKSFRFDKKNETLK